MSNILHVVSLQWLLLRKVKLTIFYYFLSCGSTIVTAVVAIEIWYPDLKKAQPDEWLQAQDTTTNDVNAVCKDNIEDKTN